MSDHEIRAVVEQLVAKSAERHHCPSISWGVVVDGRLAHHGSTGSIDGDQLQPTLDTVYRIASMTKSFTAAAVLLLRDEGALSLDDEITAHAPELAAIGLPTTDSPAVTIRHLLSMASGMATDDAWADRHLDITSTALDAALASGALFASAPGTEWEYSNLGYGLLGRVVERITGRPVQHWVTERLAGPLGLRNTTWIQPSHENWARPHISRDGVAVADPMPPLDDGGIAPMGGIWTSVADLARWITWFADAWPPRDAPDAGPLSRASRREMQQVQRYAGRKHLGDVDAPTGYGFGLLVRDDPRLGTVVGHSGGLPGYGSNMRWIPDRGIGVVALANVTYAPMAELTYAMLRGLDHVGLLPQAAEPGSALVDEVGRRLVELLNAWDDGRAEALFTDNVALDEPYERRRAAAADLVHACGGRLDVERIEATTAAAGTVVFAHPGSSHTLTFQIAPIRPARVQLYEVKGPASP